MFITDNEDDEVFAALRDAYTLPRWMKDLQRPRRLYDVDESIDKYEEDKIRRGDDD